MKTFRNTIIGALALTVGAAALFASCARDGDAMQGGERRELAVSVQMQSSDWTTRSGGGSAADGTHDRTQVLGSAALDEQLEVVTECEPIGYTPDAQNTPDAPLTRGTPIVSVTGLQSMGLSVYTNSIFTKTLTATNNGGSWDIADNITVDLDKNKYSYYAYAPAAVAADNGIVLQADGQKLTYTAPDDITKQPDLCRANPIQDDQTGTANFAMQHALTAVGIKVRADNVEIKSIKLLGVNTSGKLNLITGAWEGLGAVKDLAFTLTNNKPETGDGVANITPSDGYLMLPPQTLTGDGKKLEIVYHYTSGSDTAEHTGIHLLSDITGNAWAAGQKVHYIIQLKAKFALELSPASASVQYTAGSYTFGYTTGSAASIDPTPTDGVDWITGLNVDHVNRKISFNYSANTGTTVRQATIKVTSGFTTQNFVLKQLIDPWIKLSSKAPSGDVPRAGGSYTTTVTTPIGLAWKASTSYCSVSPESGSGSATVTITVPATTWDRDVSVTFSTNAGIAGVTEKTATWSGKQINAHYINGIWWAASDTGAACNRWTAMTRCTSPWRLPSKSDAESLINSGQAQTVLGGKTYWSSTEYGNGRAYVFDYTGTYYGLEDSYFRVRCIR